MIPSHDDVPKLLADIANSLKLIAHAATKNACPHCGKASFIPSGTDPGCLWHCQNCGHVASIGPQEPAVPTGTTREKPRKEPGIPVEPHCPICSTPMIHSALPSPDQDTLAWKCPCCNTFWTPHPPAKA